MQKNTLKGLWHILNKSELDEPIGSRESGQVASNLF